MHKRNLFWTISLGTKTLEMLYEQQIPTRRTASPISSVLRINIRIFTFTVSAKGHHHITDVSVEYFIGTVGKKTCVIITVCGTVGIFSTNKLWNSIQLNPMDHYTAFISVVECAPAKTTERGETTNNFHYCTSYTLLIIPIQLNTCSRYDPFFYVWSLSFKIGEKKSLQLARMKKM